MILAGLFALNGCDADDLEDAQTLQELFGGEDGQDGASAYDIAVENGFEGTPEEWLASLSGSDGSDGICPTCDAVLDDNETLAVPAGFLRVTYEYVDTNLTDIDLIQYLDTYLVNVMDANITDLNGSYLITEDINISEIGRHSVGIQITR